MTDHSEATPAQANHQQQQQQQLQQPPPPQPVPPEHLVCPLTRRVFSDPVIDLEGNTFERHAIEALIAAGGASPVTGTKYPPDCRRPTRNLALQRAAREWRVQHGLPLLDSRDAALPHTGKVPNRSPPAHCAVCVIGAYVGACACRAPRASVDSRQTLGITSLLLVLAGTAIGAYTPPGFFLGAAVALAIATVGMYGAGAWGPDVSGIAKQMLRGHASTSVGGVVLGYCSPELFVTGFLRTVAFALLIAVLNGPGGRKATASIAASLHVIAAVNGEDDSALRHDSPSPWLLVGSLAGLLKLSFVAYLLWLRDRGFDDARRRPSCPLTSSAVITFATVMGYAGGAFMPAQFVLGSAAAFVVFAVATWMTADDEDNDS